MAKKLRIRFCFLAMLLFVNSVQAAETSHVILQSLDKVTARVSQLVLSKGEKAKLGTLEIVMHHCDRTDPTEIPESTALLEIGENLQTPSQKHVFYGWMFASSPAVNPLQHPVYDIWVLECKDLTQ